MWCTIPGPDFCHGVQNALGGHHILPFLGQNLHDAHSTEGVRIKRIELRVDESK
jgi:hypothetical protein